MRNLLFILVCIISTSCKKEVLPKPKAYLSLQYPQQEYNPLNLDNPYSFDISNQAIVKSLPNNWLKIEYPKLKATIDITYRPVENNINEILIEAEKLVFKHTVKADEIITKDYVNTNKKVFGSFYELTGNAASNLQFHATDSTHHFIKASLYFYSKPNYDSVFPAVEYIKKDMLLLLETLEWKN